MAEDLLREISGASFEVDSAVVEPMFVRLEIIEAMKEIGIDISKQRSKSVDVCSLSF